MTTGTGNSRPRAKIRNTPKTKTDAQLNSARRSTSRTIRLDSCADGNAQSDLLRALGHALGRNHELTHEREDERDGGDRDHDACGHAPIPVRVSQRLLERTDSVDRQVRVELPDSLTNGGRDTRRLALRDAKDERRHLRRIRSRRLVHDRVTLVGRPFPNRRNNADDCLPWHRFRGAGLCQLQALTDGVRAREVNVREALIDDDAVLARKPIAFVELRARRVRIGRPSRSSARQ